VSECTGRLDCAAALHVESCLAVAARPLLCGEPLGASARTGIVTCVLPVSHKGDHDGGEAERRLGEEFAATYLDEWRWMI
jgi:hypothetical protein